MAAPVDDTEAALQRLADEGSDLDRPLVMDFFVAVPDERVGQNVAAEAVTLGFEVSVELDEETKEWTCFCSKTIIPAYTAVVEIEKQLDALGKEYGGHADGFGSFGNAEDLGT